jgi:aldehyde:ferredoxin oxidoreductase
LEEPVYLYIDNDKVEIRDAYRLWGKDTFETQDIIRTEIGSEVQVACIGQAGENLVRYATVQHELGHGAGRSGMGCVMGSKNLKAIVVRGTKGVRLSNPEKYLSLANSLQEEMRAHPIIQHRQKHGLSKYYAMRAIRAADAEGKPRPAVAYDLSLKYKPKRGGCWGCPTQCMEQYPVEAQGGALLACSLYNAPLYKIKNNDIELLLECCTKVNRYGVDVKGTFAIIHFLMDLYDRGIISAEDTDEIPMEWGSKHAIREMLRKIVFREGFGDILANGILPTADHIGRGAKNYAHQMKGIPIHLTFEAAIAQKLTALSLAVSSRGDAMKAVPERFSEGHVKSHTVLFADEKAGAEWVEAAWHKATEISGTEKGFMQDEYAGKAELVVYIEDLQIINDSLSFCKFAGGVMKNYPWPERYLAPLLSAGLGEEFSNEMLFNVAKRVKNLERAFLVREGITRENDMLPERCFDHPLENGPHKGKVLKFKEFEKMKDRYYVLRDWDVPTGIPTRETLEKSGLEHVANELKDLGKLPESLT